MDFLKGIILTLQFQRKQIFLFWMLIDILGFATTKKRSKTVKYLTLKFLAHHYHNLKMILCILTQEIEGRWESLLPQHVV